jgi:endonuclease/exonuclease/phosphatase family metal-dependent hydrolase
MFKKSIKNYLIPAINLFFVIALILAFFGSYMSPVYFLLPKYFILAFPFIVIINIVFVVFWLIFKKWYFIVSFVFLLLTYSHIQNLFAINLFKNERKSTDKELVIITYNTHANGQTHKNFADKPNGVFEYLKHENTDIICIQEYFVSTDTLLLTQYDVDTIFKNYPFKYIKFEDIGLLTKSGLAVYSKYPIINTKLIEYKSEFNASIYVDIVIKKDTIRLISNHLESNRFLGDDLVLVNELTEELNPEILAKTSILFSRRFNIAYPIRALQAQKVRDEIKKSPYPVIVCGDFNDVPNSYAYTTIKGKLHDAFIESGNGVGWTFNSSIFKSRIDYVFYDDNFEAKDFQIGQTYASDHFPIKCVLRIK